MIEGLTGSCRSLSSQLYAKSTHFLQELVQNADDNVYPENERRILSFTYRAGSLRVDCNEVGLTAANVEALCAVNQSTKSGKTHHDELTGEKGIGFKSVFKAADVVWISSREFNFKFDKTESPLGMVTPEWADFPEPIRPGYTSIFLQLSDSCNEEILVRHLLGFDANLLIFLRRIEEIEVSIVQLGREPREKRIGKMKSSQSDEGHMVELYDGDNAFQCMIQAHSVTDLPMEKKRLNWSKTRIVLGFPVVEGNPLVLPQKVYAFLPIRNYGLNVRLHSAALKTPSEL